MPSCLPPRLAVTSMKSLAQAGKWPYTRVFVGFFWTSTFFFSPRITHLLLGIQRGACYMWLLTRDYLDSRGSQSHGGRGHFVLNPPLS
ncbi:hypothetical protein FKM82_024310 [Ascaphus truei]